MIKKRIKICHLQLLPLMSGVQRSMLDVLKALDRSRYDIFVICKEQGDLTNELDRLGMRYLLIPSLVREIDLLRDMQSFIQLYRMFRKYKFDIVHTHSSKTGFLGRFAARLAGVQSVFHTVHGFPFHEFSGRPKRLFYSFFEKIGAFFSNVVIFVNHEERQYAIREKLVPENKSVTIYNGVRFDSVDQILKKDLKNRLREKWNIDPSAFVVGYFGRLWAQKDPDTLLDIIKNCRNKPITFFIAGDGPKFKDFKQEAQKNKRLILAGWVSEPYDIYPLVDIVILPSLWEGLPMSLVEAMAFGKPIIASNIKGNRECVRHAENGYLCIPKKSDQFVDAILKLYNDNDNFNSQVNRSFELSRLLFDSIKNNNTLLQLYNDTVLQD